jgi:hypothetical protein
VGRISTPAGAVSQCAETAHLTDDRFRLSARQPPRHCFGDDAVAPIDLESAGVAADRFRPRAGAPASR